MATKKQPIYYTYLIGWSEYDIWYYGSKYGKDANPELFWIRYFTSSDRVKDFRRDHGEPDVIQIRRTFDCPLKARQWEYKTLWRLKVVPDPKWLNESYGNGKWSTAGKRTGYDSNGGTITVCVDDPRLISGEIIGLTTGKVPVKDSNGVIDHVSVEDPRFISGELIHVTKGLTTAKNHEGTTQSVSVTDPRWLSGELVGVNKGQVLVRAENNNIMRVSINDVDYVSGNLVYVFTDMISVKDENGIMLKVHKNDPGWLSGELVGVNRDKVSVKDKYGNTMQMAKDDPRYLSGEFSGVMKGCKVYNNGIINTTCLPGTEPEGFVLGRLKKNKMPA